MDLCPPSSPQSWGYSHVLLYLAAYMSSGDPNSSPYLVWKALDLLSPSHPIPMLQEFLGRKINLETWQFCFFPPKIYTKTFFLTLLHYQSLCIIVGTHDSFSFYLITVVIIYLLIYVYLYGCFNGMYVCVPPACLVSTETRSRHWISQNWSYKRQWTTLWVLGINAKFSGRADSAHNHGAISPILCFPFQ